MIRGDGPYPCRTKRLRVHVFKSSLMEGWNCDELWNLKDFGRNLLKKIILVAGFG